jgi:dTDP-4-amino-4,6-dideoxygalactose transaminase
MLWPRLPLAVHGRRPSAELPFPLAERDCALVSRARHALWLGVRELGLAQPDEVLAPAYHCGAEIEALARAGLGSRFYDATETLAPDPDELETLVGSRTRALLLIHYLGFPQDSPRWRRWCDERGLLLIEDCAQALYASLGGVPVGTLGDLAVFSLYKSLPLPDGGAFLSRLPAPDGRRPALGTRGVVKLHVQWLMTRSARLDRLLMRPERPQQDDAELGEPLSVPSRATRHLLPRLATADVPIRRRAVYQRLLSEAAGRVPAAFATLPPGASPLAFPLAAADDGELESRLESRGIKARRLWQRPHPLLPARGFAAARSWRRRFLALPVHQELRDAEVERIASAVRSG